MTIVFRYIMLGFFCIDGAYFCYSSFFFYLIYCTCLPFNPFCFLFVIFACLHFNSFGFPSVFCTLLCLYCFRFFWWCIDGAFRYSSFFFHLINCTCLPFNCFCGLRKVTSLTSNRSAFFWWTIVRIHLGMFVVATLKSAPTFHLVQQSGSLLHNCLSRNGKRSRVITG